MGSRKKPVVMTCACGAEFTTMGVRTRRCPKCRKAYVRAYVHAYARGIYLTEETWREYYRTEYTWRKDGDA